MILCFLCLNLCHRKLTIRYCTTSLDSGSRNGLGGEKQHEIEGKAKKTFRIYFSARIPCFATKIMHDCVSLHAFIAPALIRIQFHYFFKVATLSLSLPIIRYHVVWVPNLWFSGQERQNHTYNWWLSLWEQITDISRMEGIQTSQLATKWPVGLFER